MLPTFFVIGAPKCGTTSLSHYLQAHPEIHMSPVKEPAFFIEPEPGRPLGISRVGDRAEYERLFESDARVRGEATPGYSVHPFRAGVPERIHALVPDARLVYVVGDPIARIVSQYLHSVAYDGERRTLAAALADPERLDRYLAASRYATQVERYLEVFPADRLHVIDQDDLRLRRAGTLASVFAFLGVDPSFRSPAFEEEQNVTRTHRRLPRAYRSLRRTRARALTRRVPRAVREPALALTRRLAGRPLPPAELDDELAARLREALQPEVARLRELTGKEFAGWSL